MSKKKLPKVAVLMSTYNGEKYIVEQIESILIQENVDIDIHIRDDGSSDRTIEIIQDYKKINSNIYLYVDGNNLGYGKSFMKLFYDVKGSDLEYDYFSFADQDDIWLKNKTFAAVKKIESNNKPTLYCSNQIIYKEGKECGLRFNEEVDITLSKQITQNSICGCTMVFNKALADVLESKDYPSREILAYRGHDAWIILQTLMCGEIVYSHEGYMKYRIHDSNVAGLKSKKTTLLRKIKRWIWGTQKGNVPCRNIRMKCAQLLLEQFPEKDVPQIDVIKNLAEYQQGFTKKIALIKDKRIREASGENFWYFAVKVIGNMI